METFSICCGVVLGPLLIGGWLLFCRRAELSKRVRGIGLALICLPLALGAVGMGKFMFVDEPFKQACYDGDLAGVKKLLSLGASINLSDDGETPLGAAMANGHEDVVIYLMDHGAEVDKSALLSEAKQRKLPRLVKALEAKGAR